MSWLIPEDTIDEIVAAHIGQFTDWFQGTRFEPAFMRYNNDDAPTLRVQNTDPDGVAFEVYNYLGEGDPLFRVDNAGVAFASLTATVGTLGGGEWPTNPEPALPIRSPVGFAIKVGSNDSPYTENAPAVSVSAVSAGQVEDGVGTALSLYAVRAANGGDGKPTTALSIWAFPSLGIPGNMSGIESRAVAAYPETYTVEATATATRTGAAITAVALTDGGSGYTVTPYVQFSGGLGANGVAATATVTMSGGVVTGITLTSGGSGYTGTPTVRIIPIAGGAFSSFFVGTKFEQYTEVVGTEMNPTNISGFDASPDYALAGLTNVRVGRSVGISSICYGSDDSTVGFYVGNGAAGRYFTGLDFAPGVLSTTNPHPANIGGQAIRFPNEGWLCGRSYATTTGAGTAAEPKLPQTIPLLKLNSGDNTILNAAQAHSLAFTNGTDPNALTTTGGFYLTTAFTVGPNTGLHANNMLNVDQANGLVGIGGKVPVNVLDVWHSGAALFAIPTTGVPEFTQTTSGSATSGAIPIPANCREFLVIKVNGTTGKIPVIAA